MSFKAAGLELWYKTLLAPTEAAADSDGSLAGQVRYISDEVTEIDSDLATAIVTLTGVVNAARDMVTTLLGGQADAATLNTIFARIRRLDEFQRTSIGESTDGTGSSSLHGKTARIGASTDAAGDGSLFAYMRRLEVEIGNISTPSGTPSALSTAQATQLSNASSSADNIEADIGTPAETGDTIFSVLGDIETAIGNLPTTGGGGTITGGFNATDRTALTGLVTSVANLALATGAAVDLTTVTTPLGRVETAVNAMRDDMGRNWGEQDLRDRIGVVVGGQSVLSLLRLIRATQVAPTAAGFGAADRTMLQNINSQLQLTAR